MDKISELGLRIHGEDSESRVIFFVVYWDRERNLDRSNRVLFWNFSKVNLQVDEGLVTSLEDILYVFGPFNKLLECGERLIYLMFIKFDKLDSFLFFFGEQFASFDDVFIVREVFL